MNGRLEAALETALSSVGPCPDVEEVAITVLEGSEEDLAALETHAAECAACAAEIALARSWEEAKQDRDDLEPRRVERVVQQAPVPTRRTAGAPRWAVGGGLAAAALALLVLGLPRTGPPSVPERSGAETIVRSQEVAGLSPDGDLAAAPAALSWDALEGARSYRVRVERVDGELVHAGETSETSYALRGIVELEPHVRYLWRVEALGDSSVIAASEEASLRVAPQEDGR